MKFALSLIHPVFMGGFFYLLYLQKQLGDKIAGLKERSPEFDQRGLFLKGHRNYAYILLGVGFVGLIGGVLATVYALGAPLPLYHSYGHGFFGLFIMSLLVSVFGLGLSIKNIMKPKIQQRFMGFHMNMVNLIAVLGILSMITGLIVLGKGPSLGG